MLSTRGEGRGEVEASPESRVPRSRHVVISSEMCVLFNNEKGEKKKILAGQTQKVRERREEGILRTTCVSEKEGRFHYARCNLIGPRMVGVPKESTRVGTYKEERKMDGGDDPL